MYRITVAKMVVSHPSNPIWKEVIVHEMEDLDWEEKSGTPWVHNLQFTWKDSEPTPIEKKDSALRSARRYFEHQISQAELSPPGPDTFTAHWYALVSTISKALEDE